MRRRENYDPVLDLQMAAVQPAPSWETGDPGDLSLRPNTAERDQRIAANQAMMEDAARQDESGSLDRFLSDKAGQADLNYSPPAQKAPASLSVQQGPSAQRAPAEGEFGGSRPSPLGLALRTLPRAIAGVALAGKAPPGYRGAGLAQNTADMGQIGNQYFRDVSEYDKRVAALKQRRDEQARAQAVAADKAAVETARYNQAQGRLDARDKRFEEAAARAAEEANPDSETNKRKRAVAGEEADAAETRAEKLAKYRNSLPYKGPAVIGTFPGAQTEEVDLDSALADQFGGEDKIPPAIKARAKLVKTVKNPSKRAAATDKLLNDVQGQSNKDRTEGRMETKAGLDETKAYMKESADWDQLDTELDRTVDALKTSGVNPDSYHGEDIPGRGPVENLLPDWAVGEAGQKVRGSDLSLMARRVYTLSGKQTNEQEFQRLQAIMGHSGGWNEQQYIDDLNFLRSLSKRMRGRIQRAYPTAAGQVDRDTPAGPTNPPAPSSGGVRIRDPKTGKTGTFKGTADEAKQRGYEVL